MWYIILGVSALVLGFVGFLGGSAYRKKSAEKAIGSAESEAMRILNDAMKTAETRKKEALLEAKDEIHQLRQETEKDLRERRSEVQRQEHHKQNRQNAETAEDAPFRRLMECGCRFMCVHPHPPRDFFSRHKTAFIFMVILYRFAPDGRLFSHLSFIESGAARSADPVHQLPRSGLYGCPRSFPPLRSSAGTCSAPCTRPRRFVRL